MASKKMRPLLKGLIFLSQKVTPLMQGESQRFFPSFLEIFRRAMACGTRPQFYPLWKSLENQVKIRIPMLF
jgi:hypothetical protein